MAELRQQQATQQQQQQARLMAYPTSTHVDLVPLAAAGPFDEETALQPAQAFTFTQAHVHTHAHPPPLPLVEKAPFEFASQQQEGRTTPPLGGFDPSRRFSQGSDSASCEASVVSDDGGEQENPRAPLYHQPVVQAHDPEDDLPPGFVLGCGGTIAAPLAYEEEVSTTHADGRVTTMLKPKRGQGYSCHHCKTTKEPAALFFCSNQVPDKKGKKSAVCKKKYCASCLTRLYSSEFSTGGRFWRCPSCKASCVCASCERKITGKQPPKKKRLTPLASRAHTPTAFASRPLEAMVLAENVLPPFEGPMPLAHRSSSGSTVASIQSGLPSVAAATAAAAVSRSRAGRLSGSARVARSIRPRASSVDYVQAGPVLAQPVATLTRRTFGQEEGYSPLGYYAESSSASASPRRYHRPLGASQSAQVSREGTPSHEAMEGIVLTYQPEPSLQRPPQPLDASMPAHIPPLHGSSASYSPLHAVRRFSTSSSAMATSAAPSHSTSPFHATSHAHSLSTSSSAAASDHSDAEAASMPHALAATTLLAHTARSTSPIIALTVPAPRPYAQDQQQPMQQIDAFPPPPGQFASEQAMQRQPPAPQQQLQPLSEPPQSQLLMESQLLPSSSSPLVDASSLLRAGVPAFPVRQSDLAGLSLEELQAMSERLELAMAHLRSEEARTAREEAHAAQQLAPSLDSLAAHGVSEHQLLEFEARLLQHQRQLSEEQASLQQQQQQQQHALMVQESMPPLGHPGEPAPSIDSTQLLFSESSQLSQAPDTSATVPASVSVTASVSASVSTGTPPGFQQALPPPVEITLAVPSQSPPMFPGGPHQQQLGLGLGLAPPAPLVKEVSSAGMMSPLEAPLMSPAMLDEILSPNFPIALHGAAPSPQQQQQQPQQAALPAQLRQDQPQPPHHPQSPPQPPQLSISLTPFASGGSGVLSSQWGLTRLSSLATPLPPLAQSASSNSLLFANHTPSPWDHLCATPQQSLADAHSAHGASTLRQTSSSEPMRLSPN